MADYLNDCDDITFCGPKLVCDNNKCVHDKYMPCADDQLCVGEYFCLDTPIPPKIGEECNETVLICVLGYECDTNRTMNSSSSEVNGKCSHKANALCTAN